MPQSCNGSVIVLSLTAYNMKSVVFCVAGKNKFCPYHCMTVPLNINLSLGMSDESDLDTDTADVLQLVRNIE